MTHEIAGRRIALIGGAGFIGHHLAIALRRLGADVSVIDGLQVNNLLTFQSKMPDLHSQDLYLRIVQQRLDLMRENGISLYIQDARDYHALSDLIGRQIKPQVIVHLAAVAHAGRSNKDPYSTFDHSLRTLENALDAARKTIEHFVFFSSSMAYGDFQSDTVTEDHPLEPKGIYGALKVAGEKMVIAYNQVFDLPFTIVRPSALYGPRCVSRRVGQIFIENALNGSVLRVEGDGSDRLDFTYIDDLVSGIVLVIQNPASRNQIFNLTYGNSRSVADLVKIVKEHFPHSRVEHIERDQLMPFRGTLSVTKAAELIGYEPRHPLEVGMAKYIDWYKELLGAK